MLNNLPFVSSHGTYGMKLACSCYGRNTIGLGSMPQIYPIGGGKGGVGKSFISASLGALIASTGRKVALIDLDLGASNLHTFLGMQAPAGGLDRFFDKTAQQLESSVVSTPIGRLDFISSCHCSMEIANLYHELDVFRSSSSSRFAANKAATDC